MIYGLVLAAGESQRMGQSKLQLPYEEKTVIETILAKVKASKLNQNLVIVNPQDEVTPGLAEKLSIEVAVNPSPERGMLSSIITGLRQIPEEAEAVIVVLGDQPAISSSIIDLLIVSYRVKGRGIIVPAYQGKRGHPVLIDLKYRQEIQNLNQEVGLRELLWRHPEDVLEIPVNEAGIIMDLDTPEDYFRLLQKLSANGQG